MDGRRTENGDAVAQTTEPHSGGGGFDAATAAARSSSPSVCYCRARTIMIMIGTTYAGAHVDSILASFMRADQPCMTNLHGFQAKARQTCTYFTCFEIRQRSPDSVFPPPAMLT